MRDENDPRRRALAGFLVSEQGDEPWRYWPLFLGRNEIGRDEHTVPIQIPHGTVANHHAIIDCGPSRSLLHDLGSINGTFHDEEPIGFQGRRELCDGDALRFGGYRVRFLALRCAQGHLVPPGRLHCLEGGHGVEKRPLGHWTPPAIAPLASRVDSVLAAIDARIARQLDEILHHPSFQRMERAWRGLWFLVERIDFAENIRVAILPATKDEIAADLAHPLGVAASGLFAIVHTAELGRIGGEPYGAILADFEVGADLADVSLLTRCAALAARALAPFIVAAGPRFFGLGDMARIAHVGDLRAQLDRPELYGWRRLRDREDARYLGLILPRFLLRAPFAVGGGIAYQEDVVADDEAFCWGNPVYAFATRLADSFARYRWCPNIVGQEGGGAVEGLLPARCQAGWPTGKRCPAEVVVTEERERELTEEGFIVLSCCESWVRPCFLSAPSAARPRYFGDTEEARAAELNHRLGTQLPYVFIVARVMHYIMLMYRNHFAEWGSRAETEERLSDWLGQYVRDADLVPPAMRGRRFMRKARIVVDEPPQGEAWRRIHLQMRPDFKHLGVFFTISATSLAEPRR